MNLARKYLLEYSKKGYITKDRKSKYKGQLIIQMDNVDDSYIDSIITNILHKGGLVSFKR